jgi:hypothetical protein
VDQIRRRYIYSLTTWTFQTATNSSPLQQLQIYHKNLLHKILSPLFRNTDSFVKDSDHFIKSAQDINFQKRDYFVSFEVVSLFINAPVEDVLEVIRNRLERILTMVYVVQNSQKFSGLFPSWLRLALSKGPNWVGVFSPTFIWGRKQIQFPKRVFLNTGRWEKFRKILWILYKRNRLSTDPSFPERFYYYYFFIIWFVRLLALRPLLAYCASLGW